MVKTNKSNFVKKHNNKGISTDHSKAGNINVFTAYDTCSEQLRPFGGLLAIIKLMDLIDFRQIFESTYKAHGRESKLGLSSMVIGLLMLLFIGFNRIGHFSYLRFDSILSGFFGSGLGCNYSLTGKPWNDREKSRMKLFRLQAVRKRKNQKSESGWNLSLNMNKFS